MLFTHETMGIDKPYMISMATHIVMNEFITIMTTLLAFKVRCSTMTREFISFVAINNPIQSTKEA